MSLNKSLCEGDNSLDETDIENTIYKVTGSITTGYDIVGTTRKYHIQIHCPHCQEYHFHGLGTYPEEQEGTERIADCFKGSYKLSVMESFAKYLHNK